MVLLKNFLAPLILAAVAVEAVPVTRDQQLDVLDSRGVFGLVGSAAKAGAKLFKGGSKKPDAPAPPAPPAPKPAPPAPPAPKPAPPSPAPKPAAPAPPPAAAPKADAPAPPKNDKADNAAACLLRARAGGESDAACAGKKEKKPKPELTEAQKEEKRKKAAAAKAENDGKTDAQKKQEKADKKNAKLAAQAKAKADAASGAKAEKAANAGSKKAEEDALKSAKAKDEAAKAPPQNFPAGKITNENQIKNKNTCNSRAGTNVHDKAAVVAAQNRAAQFQKKGANVEGFPHEFTNSRPDIDKVTIPENCQKKKLFEFPILNTGKVFDADANNINKDAGTDRVLFALDDAGNHINCGLMTHDQKDPVFVDGVKIQPFKTCDAAD